MTARKGLPVLQEADLPASVFDLTDPTLTGQSVISVHLRRRYNNDSYL